MYPYMYSPPQVARSSPPGLIRGLDKLLFVAPRNRTLASFLQESREHGWPSFRD